jgi:hypothetical protein
MWLMAAAPLAIRIVALPLPGTSDLRLFKIWAYNAATLGPSQVYGVGNAASSWRQLTFDGDTASVDYPPLALDELAVAGSAYRAVYPMFPDNTALTIAIKLLPLLAEIALTVLIVAVVRRIAPTDVAWWSAIAYWSNPAVILHGVTLGYIGTLCELPAVASLVSASFGAGWLAGALLAVACLTKPQGILVAPAVVVALVAHSRTSFRRVESAAVGGTVVTCLCLWPLVHAGAFTSMLIAVGHLLSDGWLSGNAANLWWLVLFGARLIHPASGATMAQILTAPLRHTTVADFFTLLGTPTTSLKVFALAGGAWLSIAAVLFWAMRQAWNSVDVTRLAALGALTVHLYFVLAIQVHENHLALALPLLAIAASQDRRYWSILIGLSAIQALNLNLFYGLGAGVGYAMPRQLSGLDATVILAVINCALLVWHMLVYARARSVAATADDRPGRTSLQEGFAGSGSRLAS